MPREHFSDEQVGRYGRFVADPTPEELEKFFFLDEAALAKVRGKRRLHNRMGWSIQWGTVRMVGTFLTDSGSVDVPEVVPNSLPSSVSRARASGRGPGSPGEIWSDIPDLR